jgi:NADH dehydrogenase
MIDERSSIAVFGGSGFIGSYVVKKLAMTGVKITVIYDGVLKHDKLYMHGFPGQICCIKNEHSKEFYDKIIGNSEYVINLIGILREGRGKSFQDLHVEIPKYIAHYSKKHNVKKLIHVSALGIDETYRVSRYAKSKLDGENVIFKNYHKATVIRSSVVFGHEDKFSNNFAKIIKISPFFPLINKGSIFFQPIYVADLAASICKLVDSNAPYFEGKVFEIGGPESVSLYRILKNMYKFIGKTPHFIPVTYETMKIISFLSIIFTNFPISPEEVRLLKYSNIIKELNLIDILNIQPTSINYFFKNKFKNTQYM